MDIELSGTSIMEDLIPGMGNMGALSRDGPGHARHGPEARIQVGIYRWLAMRNIRVFPLRIRPSRNSPIYFPRAEGSGI